MKHNALKVRIRHGKEILDKSKLTIYFWISLNEKEVGAGQLPTITNDIEVKSHLIESSIDENGEMSLELFEQLVRYLYKKKE